MSDKFYYTPQGAVSLSFGKAKYDARGVEDDKLSHYMIGVDPLCFEFRPTPCIGLSISAGEFGYSSMKDGDTKTKEFSFKLQDKVDFAFRFYF